MGRALTNNLLDDITLIRVEQKLVKRRTQFVEIERTIIRAVAVPKAPEEIKSDNVDYSLKYLTVTTKTNLEVEDQLLYRGIKYRVISSLDYQPYGFSTVTAEQIK